MTGQMHSSNGVHAKLRLHVCVLVLVVMVYTVPSTYWPVMFYTAYTCQARCTGLMVYMTTCMCVSTSSNSVHHVIRLCVLVIVVHCTPPYLFYWCVLYRI